MLLAVAWAVVNLSIADPSHLPEVGVSFLFGVRSRVLLSLERRLTREAAQGEIFDVRELSGVPRDGHDRLRLVQRLVVLHLEQRLFLLPWQLSETRRHAIKAEPRVGDPASP